MDYVDGNGVNRISDWLQILPFEARVKFESLLDTLKGKDIFGAPQTKILKGNCKGLSEFRFKSGNIQYRPLFCYGPDGAKKEVTILAGAIEKSNRFDPPNICGTALRRKDEIKADRKGVTKHVRIK